MNSLNSRWAERRERRDNCYTNSIEGRLCKHASGQRGRFALFQLLLSRALLLALPFLAYAVWRELAKRSGRTVGPTPTGWLIGIGAALVGLSLMAIVAFEGDNRSKVYVPAEAHPGGRVTPGHFESR